MGGRGKVINHLDKRKWGFYSSDIIWFFCAWRFDGMFSFFLVLSEAYKLF